MKVKHAQDPRVERLPCMHSGTYADDCICERVRQHRCYIVATCDRDLRRRLRKVPDENFAFALHCLQRDSFVLVISMLFGI